MKSHDYTAFETNIAEEFNDFIFSKLEVQKN